MSLGLGSSGFSQGAADYWAAARSILANRRLPHVVAPIGDSRIAAVYLDITLKRNIGGHSPLNWANALMGQRLVIGDDFGVTGNRTDQMLARISSAIATGAGLLYIQGGVNDIAQNYPTAGTSGATAFANIKTMADAGRAAGMIVVIEVEVGAQNLNTAAFVAQINDLNSRLYEYTEKTHGVYLHDARPTVLLPSNSATAIAFKTGYSSDGTHVCGLGAMYWGESLAAMMETIIPPRYPLLGRNRIEEYQSSVRRQLALNPFFNTATGGVLVNGATGTVPGNWNGYRSNVASTVACSTQADASGLGNNAILDFTAVAQGDQARMYQDVPAGNWLDGDIVEAFAEVQIAGAAGGFTGVPTGLGALWLQLTNNTGSGGQSYDNMDLIATTTAGFLGPDKAVPSLFLKTRPFTIQPTLGASPYLQLSVRAQASGAGNSRIVVKQCGVRRRDAL